MEELRPHALVHAAHPVLSRNLGQDVHGTGPARQHLPHHARAPGARRRRRHRGSPAAAVAVRRRVRVISLPPTALPLAKEHGGS